MKKTQRKEGEKGNFKRHQLKKRNKIKLLKKNNWKLREKKK